MVLQKMHFPYPIHKCSFSQKRSKNRFLGQQITPNSKRKKTNMPTGVIGQTVSGPTIVRADNPPLRVYIIIRKMVVFSNTLLTQISISHGGRRRVL